MTLKGSATAVFNPSMFNLKWMSVNAHDMAMIAVRLAGFDCKELFLEIHKLQGRRIGAKVNETTVTHAMQNLTDEWDRLYGPESPDRTSADFETTP